MTDDPATTAPDDEPKPETPTVAADDPTAEIPGATEAPRDEQATAQPPAEMVDSQTNTSEATGDVTPEPDDSEPVDRDEAEPAPSAPAAEEEPTPDTDAPQEDLPSEPPPAEAPAGESPSEPEPEAVPTPPKRTRKKAPAADATAATTATAATEVEQQPDTKKKWYAIKVQSGREDTIKAAIMRKVAIEGLEEFVGQIVIPVEEVVEKRAVRVKDKKTGEYTTQEKKVTKKKKKFHGYIFAELEFNDRILYLFRETSGVGDFLNMRGKPPVPEPMPDHEVQSMLTGVAVKDPTKKIKFKLDFEKGDKVRIREGPFANSEGEIKAIAEAKDPTETPKVTVVLTFWGRPLDVELDASQVEKV